MTLARALDTPRHSPQRLDPDIEALVTELRSLSETNRELIQGGLSAIGEALLSVRTPSAGTYSQNGRPTGNAYRPVTVDGAL